MKFSDMLRIEYLHYNDDKNGIRCRVYYQPLNIELGIVHKVYNVWRATSYDGTLIPLVYTTEKEAALAVLTVWVQKACMTAPKTVSFSDN